MIAVLLAHLLVIGLVVAFGRRLGRRVMLLGALAPATAIVWLLSVAGDIASEGAVEATYSWVPAIGLDITFRVDGFSALMVALVGGIGVLVFVYGWQYFGHRTDLGRFAANLVGFAGAMYGIVVADNLLLLFVFWELTSITSYLLIGFDDDAAAARSSALQALLVTASGGLAMLAGFVVVAQAADTYSLAAIVSDPPTTGAAGVGFGLVLVGAFTKSAQAPFHFWLPGAMTAPTPVSAYLHSATMVKAGIYLVARLAPAVAPLFVWWSPVLVVVGVTTMLVGGWRALVQHDMKLLLAQGTVSQLGFIMVLVGYGDAELTFAGMAMILAHAVFKAALFMVAGIVDHQAHTRDMRYLSGLGRMMPATFAVAVVAAASMGGIPPLLGFVTKEAALEGLVHLGAVGATIGIVVGSVLTVAYGLRFLWNGFLTDPDPSVEVVTDVQPPPGWFLAPPALLALLTVAAGVVPSMAQGVVGSAATSLDAAADEYVLKLWHGFGLPLALSTTAIVGGWAVWRYPLPRLRTVTERMPDAANVYARSIVALNRLADRVTATVQNGSLPVYAGVILSTAVLAPGVLLVQHFALSGDLTFAESGVQVATAVVVSAAAVATAVATRRLGAVLLLGAVGFGVAVLFVIQGAPDLALTQLLFETLSLAIFVLVLRRLPARFGGRQSGPRRLSRAIVAVGVGLFAGIFSLWAAAGRVAAPLTGEFLTRAEPEGGGRNVVNVILTDFRAFDTLGEITVLTVAALGVLALVAAPIDTRDEELEEVEEKKAVEPS